MVVRHCCGAVSFSVQPRELPSVCRDGYSAPTASSMIEPLTIVAAYLLGSVPFAYIMGRTKGRIDIRSVDIGNVGAGSVMRAVGLREGIFVLAADIAKGTGAVFAAQALEVGLPWVLASGLAAVLGHIYPVYIGFRGGQGIATMIGVFLAVAPKSMGLALAVMGIVLLFNLRRGGSRRLFLVVACGAPFVPLFTYAVYHSVTLTAYTVVLIAYVALRNRKGLRQPGSITRRLLGETEHGR